MAAREWALLNPAAWEKKPLTIPEVLSARMISYPFTVRDICLVTDGGGAVIMTSAERARSLKKPPAYVLGNRPGDHPRQYFEHARPDRDRCVGFGPRRL